MAYPGSKRQAKQKAAVLQMEHRAEKGRRLRSRFPPKNRQRRATASMFGSQAIRSFCLAQNWQLVDIIADAGCLRRQVSARARRIPAGTSAGGGWTVSIL